MVDDEHKISLATPQELESLKYSPGYNDFTTQVNRLKRAVMWAASGAKNGFYKALSGILRASPTNHHAIRFLLSCFFLFIIGGTWHLHRSSLFRETISLESNYYFWAKEGSEHDLRQRLAEFVWYKPDERWHRNIVQSWHTHLNNTDEYRSWEEHKADFNHLFYVDADQESCVRNLTVHNLHDIELAYFQLLTKVIVRSDFFRYFSIFAFGGIWADADTWLRKPFVEWLALASKSPTTKSSLANLESKVGMIVGIEYEHSQTLVQYVFAAKQGHPVLLELIASITEQAPEIARAIDKGEFHIGEVLSTTGPNHFTKIVQQWIKRRWDPHFDASSNWTELREPKLFGDILVLPQYAFGGNNPYHPDHHDDKPSSHDDRVLVTHEYRYSWSEG